MSDGVLMFPFQSFKWAQAVDATCALSTSDKGKGSGADMIRGYQKMREFAEAAIGIKESAVIENDGIQLRELLKGTKWEPGLEWCGFFVQRVWIAGGVLGEATGAWWLDEGSAHLTLERAKVHEKICSYPASGCMALVKNAQGVVYHYVWVESISSDGQSVTTIEGNKGDAVRRGVRRVADLIFIQP